MKNEFSLAFNEVLEEKQLPKEVILQAIEAAMVSAYRRSVNASSAQHVEAKVDPETGKVMVFAEKEVVEDVQDERTEVIFAEAREVNPLAELGDMVIVESTPKDFGRVAAQTARQVIQQRIREAERSVQLTHYESQIGEIVSGVVQAVNNQMVTIGLDMKAEGIMPTNQKIPGERFRVYDRVRAIVMEAKEGTRGPQIVLSRAHRNFLRRLMENEVPEIYHGIVEIRAISREPGQRAKVAVSATQPSVDPVGACVGVKGVRIQAIVKELHDEKIDIIEWSADPVIYIQKAISPARVTSVFLNENEKTATVVVMEDQLSLAIGRDGQNARLAAKLTNWRIDIKSVIEAVGDSLNKLQKNAELAYIAEAEAENIPAIEAILTKKVEGRPVTPEEYQTLAQFIERVERHQVEKQRAADQAIADRLAEARVGIPEIAFEQPLTVLDLPENIFNILTEHAYETAGDLILGLKADSEKVLAINGIGPKAMKVIEKAVAEVRFDVPAPAVIEAEEIVEEVPVIEVVVEEELPEVLAVESTTEVEVEVEATEEEAAEAMKSFDEIFKVRPEILKVDEVEGDIDDKDKKGKKGKKSVAYEFDETRGEVVAHKKHKRGDFDWGDE